MFREIPEYSRFSRFVAWMATLQNLAFSINIISIPYCLHSCTWQARFLRYRDPQHSFDYWLQRPLANAYEFTTRSGISLSPYCTTCKVTTSDLLYFLRYCLPKNILTNSGIMQPSRAPCHFFRLRPLWPSLFVGGPPYQCGTPSLDAAATR